MSERTLKRIKKYLYKDNARRYDGRYGRNNDGSIICLGLRREWQHIKKAYKRGELTRI